MPPEGAQSPRRSWLLVISAQIRQLVSQVILKSSSSPKLNARASKLRGYLLRRQVCPLSYFCFPLQAHSSILEPQDVCTVLYSANKAGRLQATQFTHENMTAGVAAIRSLLPVSHALSPLDTLVSAFSLSSAYGRAIAYTAIYEGTSFATLASCQIYGRKTGDCLASRTIPDKFSFLESSLIDVGDIVAAERYPIPSPTILFIKPGHLKSVVKEVLRKATKSLFLFPFARRHKLAGINDGFVTKDSLWDRLVFDGARAEVIGGAAASLRAIVVSGGELRFDYRFWPTELIYRCLGPLPAVLMTPARIALSVPLVNALTHPFVAGPVLASHPFDLQDFTRKGESERVPAHVGPPSVNVEVKLIGVDDDMVENEEGDPAGLLFARGPSVGKMGDYQEDYVQIFSADDKDEGWISTGIRALVQPNGSFIVMS